MNTESIDEDAFFEAVSHARRRKIIGALAYAEEFDLERLAERVARRETGKQPPEATVQHVSISLYHTHLPKLQEWGLVEWDSDAETVRETYRTRRVSDVLDDVSDALERAVNPAGGNAQ